MGAVYEKEYDVNYYNVDARGDAKLTSIADFFCDIGFHQSEALGLGLNKLISDNMAWIFYKYDIEVLRYPKLGEKLTVCTDALGMRKFYAYRNYLIKDAEGNIIVKGRGLFLLLDLKKRRAMRVPETMKTIYKCEEDSFELDNLDKKFESEMSKQFAVRYSDIDTNGHVNNTKYMEWALEIVPRDIILNYKMSRIKVNFIKEVQYGHTVCVEAKAVNEDEKIVVKTRILNEENTILALCETEWKKEK